VQKKRNLERWSIKGKISFPPGKRAVTVKTRVWANSTNSEAEGTDLRREIEGTPSEHYMEYGL
jgi:hypothetical protein